MRGAPLWGRWGRDPGTRGPPGGRRAYIFGQLNFCGTKRVARMGLFRGRPPTVGLFSRFTFSLGVDFLFLHLQVRGGAVTAAGRGGGRGKGRASLRPWGGGGAIFFPLGGPLIGGPGEKQKRGAGGRAEFFPGAKGFFGPRKGWQNPSTNRLGPMMGPWARRGGPGAHSPSVAC